MRRLLISLTAAACVSLPALAEAQVKTVTIDGMKADVAVTPEGDMRKSLMGDDKQDVLDMARRAAPMVVVRPSTPPGVDQPAP